VHKHFDLECDSAEKALFKHPVRKVCYGCGGYFYIDISNDHNVVNMKWLCPTCKALRDFKNGGDCCGQK
jgi:hypothetical protein